MKIVVLDESVTVKDGLNFDGLRKFGDLTVYAHTRPEEVRSRIGDAAVVLINKAPITREIMADCPNLKLICVLATGYNVVDCAAAREHGISVCNVPGYSTYAVSQFTIALLLELCHKIGHHDEAVRQGRWQTCGSFCFWDTPQVCLEGKTMGIYGFGHIGRAVGRIAKALGMNVLACNRSRCPEGEEIAEYVSFDELLRRSDVISLHCPLTAETQGLINAEAIAKMKNGAMLLNTARGPLVEENALAEALKCGKLRGAAMDVANVEPIPMDSPLLSAPNCVLTPHMAWAPVEARAKIVRITEENIRCFLAGTPQNVVN